MGLRKKYLLAYAFRQEPLQHIFHIIPTVFNLQQKYERWWAYVADRRTHQLITAPVYVCSLKDVEDVSLIFILKTIYSTIIYTGNNIGIGFYDP